MHALIVVLSILLLAFVGLYVTERRRRKHYEYLVKHSAQPRTIHFVDLQRIMWSHIVHAQEYELYGEERVAHRMREAIAHNIGTHMIDNNLVLVEEEEVYDGVRFHASAKALPAQHITPIIDDPHVRERTHQA